MQVGNTLAAATLFSCELQNTLVGLKIGRCLAPVGVQLPSRHQPAATRGFRTGHDSSGAGSLDPSLADHIGEC